MPFNSHADSETAAAGTTRSGLAHNLRVVVMGVEGSGKTTIGTRLAAALGCDFLEGDGLHSAANIAKMARGIQLTDQDRAPWLEAIRQHLAAAQAQGTSLVVACSALKQSYRDYLAQAGPLIWVYLKGSEQLLRERVQGRQHHYAKLSLLPSQLATLEVPHDAIVADIAESPDRMVANILAALARLPAQAAAGPPAKTPAPPRA